MWIDFLPASTDQSKAVWLKGIRFWKQFHFYVEKVQVMLLSKEGKGRFPKIIRAEVQGILRSQHRPKTYLGTWYTVSPETPCCWLDDIVGLGLGAEGGLAKRALVWVLSLTSCVDFRGSLSITDYPASLKMHFPLSSMSLQTADLAFTNIILSFDKLKASFNPKAY